MVHVCALQPTIARKIRDFLNVHKRQRKFESACRSIERLFAKAGDKRFPQIRITGYIASGSFGHVFEIKQGSRVLALKILKISDRETRDEVASEIQTQRRMAAIKVAPSIVWYRKYTPDTRTTYAAIAMERIDGTIGDLLGYLRVGKRLSATKATVPKKLLATWIHTCVTQLYDMVKSGTIHADYHWWNIGYKFKNNETLVMVIDFGMSTKGRNIEMDLVQLIRTAHRDYAPEWHTSVRKVVRDTVIHYYKKEGFNMKYLSSISKIEKRYSELKRTV